MADFTSIEPNEHETRLIHGRRTRKTNHNVYILGAGFSADAGLPTIADFLNHMRDAADWLAKEHRDAERAAVEDVLEFRHNASAAGYRINLDLDNIEDLFSLAAAGREPALPKQMQTAIAATLNHARVHGSPREIRLRVKRSDSSWPITPVWRRGAFRVVSAGDAEDIFCSIYDFYAALLAGRCSKTEALDQDVVITFNYDLLLEESLARLGIPFSYDLGREGVNYRDGSASGTLNDGAPFKILKLHGSLNWALDVEGQLNVFPTYDDMLAQNGTPHVVPPTWDKAVTAATRGVWSAAVAALKQATRIIVIGFSFRVIDAHFKYLLAAGLMENSALRKVIVVNPHATKLTQQIRAVVRRDQFDYGVVEQHDRKLHEFATTPEALDRVGRPLCHEALRIVEIENEVRLMAGEKGMYIAAEYGSRSKR